MLTDGPASRAHLTAHRMVHCVLDGDEDGLGRELETVVERTGNDLREYVRAVVAELIRVAATAVRFSSGNPTDRTAYTIDLRDGTNDQVSIDDLDPPARATVRAMLAELNGSQQDASIQLDLAVQRVDPLTGLETVRRALTMTVGVLSWSQEDT
jgi:hypothetical protein